MFLLRGQGSFFSFFFGATFFFGAAGKGPVAVSVSARSGWRFLPLARGVLLLVGLGDREGLQTLSRDPRPLCPEADASGLDSCRAEGPGRDCGSSCRPLLSEGPAATVRDVLGRPEARIDRRDGSPAFPDPGAEARNWLLGC